MSEDRTPYVVTCRECGGAVGEGQALEVLPTYSVESCPSAPRRSMGNETTGKMLTLRKCPACGHSFERPADG